MRRTGVIDHPTASAHSHICWVFEGHDAFARCANEFLREGFARRERVAYVAAGESREALKADLVDLPDVDHLVSEGSLVVRTLGEVYGDYGDAHLEPQLQAYEEMTTAAVRDGYTGLRVAADATALVATEAQRRRFLSYEVKVDRLMSRHPMTALCGYDVGVLGAAALELCAVHPERHTGGIGDPRFQIYNDAGTLHLGGELDLSNHSILPAALDAAAAAADDEFVIDLTELDFIDVAGVRRLATLASTLADEGRRMRVTGASQTMTRCAELLGFESLRSATDGAGHAS